MKRIIALLLACMMVIGLFAACGGSETPAETQAAAAAPAETAAAEATVEKLTMKVWCPGDELEATRKMVENFAAAHPEYDCSGIEVVDVGIDEAETNLLNDADLAADVLQLPSGGITTMVEAGLLLPISVNFFDAVLKIDDPVGAISVHGVCGSAGTLMTGLFAVDGGVFYGGGFHFFGIQCLGVAATALWTTVMITIVFLVIKHTIGLRVSVEEELKGLDITEHGLPSAYGGFAFNYDDTPADLAVPAGSIPVQEAVPVEVVSTPVPAPVSSDGVKMTKIEILCKMERFDALKRAMFDIGITGMTAINVMGCGEQRGKTEGYFRGAKVEATMLPSIQVSIVVCKLPVSLVVNTAKKVLYTGHYGDGKIFIYNVENVIKVRTGEQGYDALQDEVQ